MSDLVRNITEKLVSVKKSIAAQKFRQGDTVGVYVRVREGDKERVQLYKGVVIKTQGEGKNKSFTVRKISSGIGVERTFPYSSPSLDRIEVISKGKVRRGKLYFLRDLKGKAARLQSEILGLKDELPPDAEQIAIVQGESASRAEMKSTEPENTSDSKPQE